MLNWVISIISAWIVPLLILVTLLTAQFRRIKVFDTFVEGAKNGFQTAVCLIPFLVGMMIAIGLFNDSGAMDIIKEGFAPFFDVIQVPSEVLPLAIMRPISGSSALAITTDILHNYGPDSLIGRIASTMQGSTDTTLFILTVYFGTVGIKRTRHALPVGLLADFAGFLAAVTVCNIAFG